MRHLIDYIMCKVFVAVLVLFGTVLGSGFASGKEIVVFFSRFGNLSFLYIFFASVLFFLLFYFFLKNAEKILRIIEKSKVIKTLTFFVSLIFCASMFAGLKNLFSQFPDFWSIFSTTFVLFICIFFTLKGIKGIEGINVFLMPFTMFAFLTVLVFCSGENESFNFQIGWAAGILFCPLYVALNSCMSGLVLCKLSKNLNKKQVVLTCLFASFLIFFFLTFANFVLLKNGLSFFDEMPFLFLSKSNIVMFLFEFIVVFSGCLTTLLSLCFNLCSMMNFAFKNTKISAVFACLLPFALSSLGFSQIVSFLYPICSVFGVFMIFYLVFKCDDNAFR